ncbi:hypothetical protein LP085_03655 [Achromobacter sp. MY14]|uniref:hypothetical protein n=1 Tax=unclassified Achromobacter TaxID=2626865 RepID=UPI001E3F2127|nr:hypothetical protein [Achromobacter sp. MY14]MCD0495939.1 hypothetical protein [Achromobacter sp. MY14]
MNAITASAPAARRRILPSIAQVARKAADLIAPRDHAGKGNWSKDANIPRVWAWSAGIAFAAFFLFGRQVLSWLLSFAI